jgi:hypothetical protein
VLDDGQLLTSGSAVANTLSLSTSGAGYSSLSVTGYPGLSLDLAATASPADGHTSTFMLTQTGLTTATPYASFFDSNSGLLGALITWSVYANVDNALYGTESLLGTWNFTDYGYLVSASSSFTLPSWFDISPYSMTALVTITPEGSPPEPVPEPGSFMLLATGLAATGLARRGVRWQGRRRCGSDTNPASLRSGAGASP